MLSFGDLKNRKVIQWTVAYAAGAWAALQAISLLSDSYDWSPAIMRVAPVVLLGCLLLVVVLAWFHGERGGQRFKPVELFLLIVIFVATGTAALVFAKQPATSTKAEAAPDVPAKSVAVLPFASLSSGEENAYFASGIHDELLTQLAQLGDMKVISRTSVLPYKDANKPIKQIAQELGVAAIVEGSVQRAGNRVRVQAQLIDARSDGHLWAERYDRELTDIFEIQSDIARQIATALKATLSPAEETRLASRPTSNTEAYDLYLRARDYGNRSYSEANARTAIGLLDKAVALDPNFAGAWAYRAIKQCDLYWFHFDRSKAIQDAALASAKRAIKLNPDLPEAHAAMANYLYHVRLDYEGALREIEIARKGAPNDVEVVLTTAAIMRRQGRVQEALPLFLRATSLDPRSASLFHNLAETYALLRRYDEANKAAERGVTLAPDEVDAAMSGAHMQILHTGDMAAARRHLDRLPKSNQLGIYSTLHVRLQVELFDRRPDEAIKLIESSNDSAFYSQFWYMPRSMVLGDAYRMKGDAATARKHYAEALRHTDVALKTTYQDDPRVHMARGLALAALGRKQEAIAAGQRAASIMPIEKEAWRGSRFQRDLALIYAHTGEPNKAADILERLLKMPADVGIGALRKDPAWDPLRPDPRFQALLR